MICTVADSRFVSSTSVAVSVVAIGVAASPSVNVRVVPAATTGASLTAATVTVRVLALLFTVPSFTWNCTVRASVLGFCDVLV